MLRFAGITLSLPGRRELVPPGADAVGRVLPISSIRFVLAMWVVLSHFGIPILQDHKQTDILGAFRALVNTAFNGPALSSGAILRMLPIYAATTASVAWFGTMLCCGTLATAFYWLIERPSHRFARYFTRHSGFSRVLPGFSPAYAPMPAEVVISTGGKSPS